MTSRKRAFADLQSDQPTFEPDAYAQQGLPEIDYNLLNQNINQVPFQGGQMVPYIQPGAFSMPPSGFPNTYLEGMPPNPEVREDLAGDDGYPDDLEKRIADAKAKKKKLPPFVEKVATFVNDENNQDIIRWSDDGDSFVVLDEDRFSKELIPGVFKHNNFASFVRQLNMYNFHKKVGMTDGSLKASMDGQKARLEYEHKYFKRSHPDMLFLIEKPKTGRKSKSAGGKKVENVKEESDDDLISDDDHYDNDRGGSGAPRLIEDAPLGTNKHEFYGGATIPQTGPSPVTNIKPSGPAQPYSSIVAVVDHIVSQINDLKTQQNMISTAITRLRQDHQQLAKQASAFQEMHDRHEMSISNILQFLASVYNKNIDGMNQNGIVSQPNNSVIPAFGKHPAADMTNARPAKRRRFLIEDGRGTNGGGKPMSNFDAPGEDVRLHDLDHLQDMDRLQELDTPTELTTPSVRQTSVTPTPVGKQSRPSTALVRNIPAALTLNNPPVPIIPNDHELRHLEQRQTAVDQGLKELQQNVENLADQAGTIGNFDLENIDGFNFPSGDFDSWIAGLSPGSLQNVNEEMHEMEGAMHDPLNFDQNEIENGVLNTHIDSANGTPEPGQRTGAVGNNAHVSDSYPPTQAGLSSSHPTILNHPLLISLSFVIAPIALHYRSSIDQSFAELILAACYDRYDLLLAPPHRVYRHHHLPPSYHTTSAPEEQKQKKFRINPRPAVHLAVTVPPSPRVMRFLQTEWHRHERERNQWEIERAEMRARIAKLEGESSAAKRLQQGYLKRVKMLEAALKAERSKNAKVNGASPEDKDGDKADLSRKESILEIPQISLRSEEARKKSRHYLDECLKEITYLLLPPNHPPPPNPPQSIDPMTGHPYSTDQQLSSLPQFPQQLPSQQLQKFPDAQHRGGPTDLTRPLHPAPISILPAPPLHQQLQQGQTNSANLQHAHAHENRFHGNHVATKQASLEIQNATGSVLNQQSADKASQDMDALGEPLDSADTGRVSSVEIENADAETNAFDDAWDFDDGKTGSVNIMVEPSRSPRPLSDPPAAPASSSSRRKSITRRRLSQDAALAALKQEPGTNHKVKFQLRGHLDVIRAITFTGGGSAVEPEICSAGDDGAIKRWTIPGGYLNPGMSDVDVVCNFTHRGHTGMVTSLASSHTASLSGGLSNDCEGWVFSGSADTTVKVWQKGQVDARATLVGHTDVVWAVCVLPLSRLDDRITLVSGAADGTVKIWTVPPPVKTTHNSIRSMQSSFLSSSSSSKDDFTYQLVTTIKRDTGASPTSITPLSPTGETFIVAYNDASIIIYDSHTGEELVVMSSLESYDGTPATGVNTVVATTLGLSDVDQKEGVEEEVIGGGATGGGRDSVTGVVIAGTEDRFVRFYDANSGQCTYNMLAHPAAISCLALQTELKMLVSAAHDGSLRFWDLEKRACIQELPAHRLMREEGACVVVWSADGRWVVSGGGDGVVKVYSR
ncbi:Striatin-3 [Drechslerella dactyloides]|uniref:Striatin-3 n=1 Tax=Drechslerella dactyloides TaxID=74499 RepID=A0AAD6J259_DREDA|nr:Striatin-3 [Drechslerella dactyloides]